MNEVLEVGKCTALIRTFNSASTLPATLDSLSKQEKPPDAFVFVDSGSTDRTLELLPPRAKLHAYVGHTFNYARALNQGLEIIETEYALVISSHTRLANPHALQYALNLLESEPDLGAAYFDFDSGELRHTVINEQNFDGFNGLWNTCSLLRVDLLHRRPFAHQVPASEDQEWAAWLIQQEAGATARISGGGMDNPFGTRSFRPSRVRKVIRERAAVMYYIRDESPAALLLAALKPGGGFSWRHRALQSAVALRLARLRRS